MVAVLAEVGETVDSVVSNWEKIAVISSIVTAGLFVLVLGFQIWSAFLTRKAVKAATDSAAFAERANARADEEVAIRLRPWIGIGSINIDHVQSTAGNYLATKNPAGLVFISPSQLPDDAQVAYNIPIINYGALPASRVGIETDTGFDQAAVEREMRKGTGPRDSVVAPGQTLNHVLLVSLRAYKHAVTEMVQPLYVACSVVYEDREAKTWVVEGIYTFIGPQISKLRETVPEPWPRAT